MTRDRGTGLLRHMVARRGVRTGELLLTVVTAAPVFPGSRAFVGALRSAFPELVTVVQQVNSRRTSAVLSGPEKTLFGGGFLTDELCGSRFRVPAGAFYQINHDQTERLYETALDFAGLTGGETVLDAYCGIGTITLAAAKRAKRVLGVEINAAAVRAAAANARLNGADNVSFLCGDAGAELEKAVRAGARFDAVFLDPTRGDGSIDVKGRRKIGAKAQ
jgi:23S rRNA (uracil1939-C5)-methyltransferase